MTYDRDVDAAARYYEKALALGPTEIEAISNAAIMAALLGRLELATELKEFTSARDTVSPG